MVNENLPGILEFFKKSINDKIFNRDRQREIIFDLIKRENKLKELTEFKGKIQSKWEAFVNNNQKRLIKKTYTSFLYEHFHDIFKEFIQNFYGFNEDLLEHILKENISDTHLLLEYNYYIDPNELNYYEEISKNMSGNLYGVLLLTGYLFSIIGVLGIIIKEIIDKKILITLDCAVLKEKEQKKFLSFMILVRDEKKEIFNSYLELTSFYFLKQFKEITESDYSRLLESREKLFQIALNEYTSVKDKLADLFFYFYKKCKLLENFCPLLDFLNFVCSRVEDSVFDKFDIIRKEFFVNFDYTTEKKNSLITIFDFIDSKTTLYSTFQANNLPTLKAQFNLFQLIIKYFFSTGLEPLEVGELLYFPDIFKQRLNQYNNESLSINNQVINSKTIDKVGNFSNLISILSNVEDLDLVFKKVFNKGISQINYRFFRSFLKSFNLKIFRIIEHENQILAENPNNKLLTFNSVIEHICRILYTLINKIFLKDNPDDASENFIDPRGRYIGKNIALRVLELFMFQDINYSDDIWTEYLVSLKKEEIRKILNFDIPEKYFYSDKEIVKILTIYNFQSFSNAAYFEEWLLDEIIIPLEKFISKINNSLEDKTNINEIYRSLSDVILKDLDSSKYENFEDLVIMCQQIAQFWPKLAK